MFVGAFFCVRLIFSVLLSFTCAIVCGRSFLERVISTHFIRLLFVFAARVFGGFVMLWAPVF